MKITKIFMLAGALFFGLTLVSFISVDEVQDKKPWDIPAEYKSMKNPISSDANSLKIGKMLYNKHCKSCHGTTGKGDGPRARTLKTTDIGDFSSATWHGKYNDGEVYYMSIIGRDEMPNYEKKIPVKKDRWHVVNYIRSMK